MFEVRCKATSLTVSLGFPVHGKYLMAKPMGFADQCKPSSARPVSEARATWQLLLSLLFCGGSGEQLQESEFTYKFIFVQMERTSPSRCFFQVGNERRRFIHFERSRYHLGFFWYFGPLGFHSNLLSFRRKYPRCYSNSIIGNDIMLHNNKFWFVEILHQ